MSKSDDTGALIEYVIESGNPIIKLEIDLEGDGLERWTLTYRVGNKRDGRYWRAASILPEVVGTWPLVMTASTNNGKVGTVRCLPGITVTP